jgi:DNA polymerase III delta subunit
MDLITLVNKIKAKNCPKVLVFTGEEQAVAKTYINGIARVFGLTISRKEDIKIVLADSKSKTLTNEKKLYVLYEDKLFRRAETVWKNVDKLIGDNYLIAIYPELDKREKFYKHFTNTAFLDEEQPLVSFEKLSEDQLLKYVFKEISLNAVNSQSLVKFSNFDYGRLLFEIDKLKQLYLAEVAEKGSADYNDIFQRAIKCNLFYSNPEDRLFDFANAVLSNDYVNSLKLLDELQQYNENNLKALAALYTNFKNMLLVQGCPAQATPELTGLSSGQIYYLRQQKNHYTTLELIENIKIIRSAEKGIKIGLLDSEIALDYVTCQLLRR